MQEGVKYKVVGDSIAYGGPKKYEPYIQRSNQSLTECIDFLRSVGVISKIDLGEIVSTPGDNMGCYRRFQILIDRSVETLWSNLSKVERGRVFDYARAWMGNEMAEVPLDLYKKIEDFEE